MKKIVLIGLALILIALGFSARWWLSPLLTFAGTNGDAIQSITSLVQLAIWGGAAIVAIIGWAFSRKPASKIEAAPDSPVPVGSISATGTRSVATRDVVNSEIITGDHVNAAGAGAVATGGDINRSNILTGNVGEFVAGDKIVQEAPRPIVTSLRQLLSPPPDFTDRETEIAHLMAQFESGVTTYVLQGMGGVGKSDLAFKLAEELSPHYEDGQFYLDLQGTSKQPLSVAEIMTHVISSYNLTSELPKTEAGLRGMYRSVLDGKRALLLMDNAANDEQVKPLLQPDCALVITSRQSLVLPKMFVMNVNPLSPEDAREMLKKITDRIDDKEADAIAELCGCLPLALRVAASAINKRRTLSVASYVQRLRDASERLELVEASLSLSYELLTPERQRLFCSLAVFPNKFDLKAIVALWELPQNQAEDVVSDLVAFSLVEWDEAASRYRLQELVRIFADARLGEQERSAYQKRHALFFLGVLREAGELYFRVGRESEPGLKLFDVEWANIQASQQWVIKHISEDEVATAVSDTYSYAGAHLLAVRRLPQERLAWHEAVVGAAQQAKRPSVEGSNLCFLGIAHRDLGDYDQAINYCEAALAIARQQKDPREESNALSYIGIAYYYKGQYEKAIDYCDQALNLTRQAVKDKRSEIEQLRYLGHAQRGLGQFEQTVSYYQQSLQAARQIGDLNGENSVLGGLGRLYCDMGKHEQAIKEYLPEAVKLAREIGDRRGEGFNLAHLGLAHRDMGRYTEAQTYYEQALLVARAIGERNMETYCLGGLGKTYLALDQAEAALEHVSAALKLATRIGMNRGQQHWGTALAQVYLHRNRLPDALETVKAALLCNCNWNNYRTSALHGLILVRLNQVLPAQAAFEKATEYANQLLKDTPSYFDARYILGLAACGMALTTTEKRSALIAQARAAYQNAYSSCNSPGVVKEALRLMDELQPVNGAGELSPVRDFLKGLLGAGV